MAVLQVHAKRNGFSVAELVGNILDDYVVWLVQELKEDKTRGDKKK